MKIMPIASTRTRSYTRNNCQSNYANMTQPRDTVSFSSSTVPRFIGRSNTIAKIQNDLGKAIRENNVKEILEYFGINCKADKNNLLTISKYSPRVRYLVSEKGSRCKSIFFSELGINENNLFKKIIAINFDADFECSELTDLGRLEKIGGIADFRHSKVTDLSELKNIGGGAVFRDSQVSALGKLETIGHDADFCGSQITNLGELKRIGGSADFANSKITNLGKLESIEWTAYFNDSQVTDLGELKTIGHNAYFSGSQVTALGKLKTIGGNAEFSGSQVTDLGELETIELTLDISNTNINNLGKLKSVGSRIPYSLYGRRSYVIKLNEYINPKDAEHLVMSDKIDSIISVKANSIEQYKKLNSQIEQTKNEIVEKPDVKLEQPKKETIEKPINNPQEQKTNEKPSFVQKLKATWKALTGN